MRGLTPFDPNQSILGTTSHYVITDDTPAGTDRGLGLMECRELYLRDKFNIFRQNIGNASVFDDKKVRRKLNLQLNGIERRKADEFWIRDMLTEKWKPGFYGMKPHSPDDVPLDKSYRGDSGISHTPRMPKPHCFLASDHDIGGFFEPFYRKNGVFEGELNMTKYLEKNIWGLKDSHVKPLQPYFKDEEIEEGPLTIMMNKSMFDSSDQAYWGANDWQVGGRKVGLQNFTTMDPWKYGTTYWPLRKGNHWFDRNSDAQQQEDFPYYRSRDAWFRQCNFLDSIGLVNYNLDNNQWSKYAGLNEKEFRTDFSIDKDGFLDQMLNLNKPCPVYKDKVWLFGRIRKTQEVKSRNTDEFNWNHLRQAGLRHASAGKIMPLRLSSSEWLNNDVADQTPYKIYKDYLTTTYSVPVAGAEHHPELEQELIGGYRQNDDAMADPLKLTDDMTSGFTHREVMNTVPIVWGMNITGGNEMYVPPIYGSNYGNSMYNDVEKTYPHPYTVSFTYDKNGAYAYRGMVPNSISPQWGACVAYEGRLICLGGMICYHHSRKNAAFSLNARTMLGDPDFHSDSLLCDNLDDAPHNMAISPKEGGTSPYEWETSISSPDLKKFRLPIGLLGHSAITIKNKGEEEIHVFGGMWGKLSNYRDFGFHHLKQSQASDTQSKYNYDALKNWEYHQTWNNAKATPEPRDRISRIKFKPNEIWSPQDVSYAITHQAVAKFSLVFRKGEWHRGPKMLSRRFGHTTMHLSGKMFHIGGMQPTGRKTFEPESHVMVEEWKKSVDLEWSAAHARCKPKTSNEAEQGGRKRRSSSWLETNEGVPYNPKPFLYDGWSKTMDGHDPTLQNYFFRTHPTKKYTKDSALFRAGKNLDPIDQDVDLSDFLDNNDKAFFEHVREARMNNIKYAPCKYCDLGFTEEDFLDADTTKLQVMGNDNKIHKLKASLSPRLGAEWQQKDDSGSETFKYYKFDFGRLPDDTSTYFVCKDVAYKNGYFDRFRLDRDRRASYGFIPSVFNVNTGMSRPTEELGREKELGTDTYALDNDYVDGSDFKPVKAGNE